MSSLRITGVVAVLGILLTAIWFFTSDSGNTKTIQQDDTNTANSGLDFSAQEEELYIGNPEAPAVMVEYADFKCPSCGQFHQTNAKELRKAYPDNLKIAFRPIAVIGPDSERAAVGAYCALEQEGFVQYHDAVFDYMWDNYYEDRNFAAEFEDILTADVLTDISKKVGISETAFRSCLDDSNKQDLVATNLTMAQQVGVRGTPTFVIDDQLVTGPQPFNVFKSLVDLQLQ